MITKEDFDLWRDSPVTERVFAAMERLHDQTKQKWVSVSWDGGNADPLVLADLRARAEIIRDLCEVTFEEIEEIMNERKP